LSKKNIQFLFSILFSSQKQKYNNIEKKISFIFSFIYLFF